MPGGMGFLPDWGVPIVVGLIPTPSFLLHRWTPDYSWSDDRKAHLRVALSLWFGTGAAGTIIKKEGGHSGSVKKTQICDSGIDPGLAVAPA